MGIQFLDRFSVVGGLMCGGVPERRPSIGSPRWEGGGARAWGRGLVEARPEVSTSRSLCWGWGVGGYARPVGCKWRGLSLPTQGDAWRRSWHLAPEDVRASRLTSPRLGGPNTKAQKALFPTLFKGMDAALYLNARRGEEVAHGQVAMIEEAIKDRAEQLSYAARCLEIVFAEYHAVAGRADPNHETVFSITRTIIEKPVVEDSVELAQLVRGVILERLCLAQPAAERRFSSPSLREALSSVEFVEQAQRSLDAIWSRRVPNAPVWPGDLSGLLDRLEESLYPRATDAMQIPEESPVFEESWEPLLAAVQSPASALPTSDEDLLALGLADKLLKGDGTRRVLTPPALVGGTNTRDFPPLDMSVEARCTRVAKGAGNDPGLPSVDHVVTHVVTASAELLGLSLPQTRSVLLLGARVAAQAGLDPLDDGDAAVGMARRFAASYRRHYSRAGRRRTARLDQREFDPVPSFVRLLWGRAVTAEVLGSVPESPEDVDRFLVFAWRTWTMRTLDEDSTWREHQSAWQVDHGNAGLQDKGAAELAEDRTTQRLKEFFHAAMTFARPELVALMDATMAGGNGGRGIMLRDLVGEVLDAIRDRQTDADQPEGLVPYLAGDWSLSDGLSWVDVVSFIRTHHKGGQ